MSHRMNKRALSLARAKKKANSKLPPPTRVSYGMQRYVQKTPTTPADFYRIARAEAKRERKRKEAAHG